jgi:hypothetical protein
MVQHYSGVTDSAGRRVAPETNCLSVHALWPLEEGSGLRSVATSMDAVKGNKRQCRVSSQLQLPSYGGNGAFNVLRTIPTTRP